MRSFNCHPSQAHRWCWTARSAPGEALAFSAVGDGGGRLLEGSDRRFALRSLGRGLLGPDLAFGHLRVFVRELAFQLSTIQG
jgi:hypothetical protein